MRVILFTYTLPAILAVCLSACEAEPITQDISILLDQTEEHFTHVSVEDIAKKSVITESITNGESIRILSITELGFNAVSVFRMDVVTNVLLDNDFERDSLVVTYFTDIDSALSGLLLERRERTGSVICKILAGELNRLSASSVDRKLLIINSDLMEKSFIDFYSTTIFNQIKNEPAKIMDTLIKRYPLKSLQGIEIYIVYKPTDKSDSERFEIISGFYENFLESLGAKVFVGSDLNTQN
ncbi:MAG TPA: hypothetical protein PLJ00_03295 [Chitinophagales bacterium]|nr:hypothetical protein [Chitinophagales bacterium]HRG26892.1 hypothetical protein [Chitinophagales bacterium]HRG85218.1 hypothetical protein [Chitinophagales bacterium]HRH51814.1 hypothetical protein [Chitinophagales bacterium]